jgi:hypothetical protein
VKRTRLNPISKKRRAALPARSAVIREVHERDQHCQFISRLWAPESGWEEGDLVGVPTRCSGPLDVHEIIPRSAWSAGWLEPSNCVLLCRLHHSWVTENPRVANLLGLHKFSHERPA